MRVVEITRKKTIHRLQTKDFHIDAKSKAALIEAKRILHDINIAHVDILIRRFSLPKPKRD